MNSNRTFSLLFFLLSVTVAIGQKKTEEVTLNFNVGDTLVLGKCSGAEVFRYIDLYSKTRRPDTTVWFNEETGEGFYTMFFENGDIDGSRMPCTMQGKKVVIIKGMNVTEKGTGRQKWVILAWVNRPLMKVAWIEIEPAYEAGEVTVP